MSQPKVWRIGNGLVELGVLEVGGQLGPVRFRGGDMPIEPMHIAPWCDERGAAPIPMLQHLRGDFFCAPFGANDLLEEEDRDHGATANGSWRLTKGSATGLELELVGRVAGAGVRKEIWLEPGQPVVYQRHTFEGGAGRLPLGHHAMLRAPEGERLLLSFAQFSWGGTPPEPVESDPQRGRSLLRYPQRFESLGSVAGAHGEPVDLSRYPALESSEEILMLVTDPDLPLAWSTAVAPRSGWVWFSLRPNRVLRSTMLWMSNGGRDYPPFLGRHRRVIGIEEVTSYFHLGHRASLEPPEPSHRHLPTSVELDPAGRLVVSYAFGAVPVPGGFRRVADLRVERDALILDDEDGRRLAVPFDPDFLA